MKHLIVLLFLAISLMYCTSKKKSSTTTTTASTSTASNDVILSVAQKRWNGTTQADLDEGKKIFTTKCTKCHEEMKIAPRSEKSWLHEIDDMSPKADLTADEKLKLTKYILSVREANNPTTSN